MFVPIFPRGSYCKTHFERFQTFSSSTDQPAAYWTRHVHNAHTARLTRRTRRDKGRGGEDERRDAVVPIAGGNNAHFNGAVRFQPPLSIFASLCPSTAKYSLSAAIIPAAFVLEPCSLGTIACAVHRGPLSNSREGLIPPRHVRRPEASGVCAHDRGDEGKVFARRRSK